MVLAKGGKVPSMRALPAEEDIEPEACRSKIDFAMSDIFTHHHRKSATETYFVNNGSLLISISIGSVTEVQYRLPEMSSDYI